MDELRISTIQIQTAWNNKALNLIEASQAIVSLKGQTDLVVLPELFTTGFAPLSITAEALYELAETDRGVTISTLRGLAEECKLAIVGSFLAIDDHHVHLYNRGFIIYPDQDPCFYDKRHLFRMGGENKVFTANDQKRQPPFSYLGWNIRLAICYELRFPVWLRNTGNEYDLLVCMANWPEARLSAWNTLLAARAIENFSYVVGCNCVGVDPENISYNGHSSVFAPDGKLIGANGAEAGVETFVLSKERLMEMRERFPAWQDADQYTLARHKKIQYM